MEEPFGEKIRENESAIEEGEEQAGKQDVLDEKPLYFEKLIADLDDFSEEEPKQGLSDESGDLFEEDTSEGEREEEKVPDRFSAMCCVRRN